MTFRASLSQKFLFGWGVSALLGLVLVGVTFSLMLKGYHQTSANIILEKSFRIVNAQLNLRAQRLTRVATRLARDREVVTLVNLMEKSRDKEGKRTVSPSASARWKEKLIRLLSAPDFFTEPLQVAVYAPDRTLLAFYRPRRGAGGKDVSPPVFVAPPVPGAMSTMAQHAYRIFSRILYSISSAPIVWRGANARDTTIGTVVVAYRLDAPFAARMARLLGDPFTIRTTLRTGMGALGGLVLEGQKPFPDLTTSPGIFRVIPDQGYFVGAQEIRTANAARAVFFLGIDKRTFVSGFGTLRRSILWSLAVIAIVILPIGAYFVWRNLTRPISQLMSGVEALVHRETGSTIMLASHDELGMLAQSLNVMAQTIRTREHDLKSSRDQLRLVTDNLPFLIAYVDTNRIYRFVNQTCAEWCARPLGKMIGMSVPQVLGGEYSKVKSYVDTVLNAQDVTYDDAIHFPDGVTRSVRVSYIAHRGTEGKIEGFFAIAADMTDIRHAEEQLRHAQKMESVGQLTGGIAHDFNNILNIVMGNLELLQRMELHNDKVQERLENALRGVRRGADLTRKLLGFSSRNPWQAEVISVNLAIENIHSLIAKSLTVAVNIEMHLADDLWLVEIDPGDFADIILNLALNARDAMPAGGLLVIETQNKILDRDYVRRNPEGRMGEHVMISLSDTGTGMIAEVCERIFDPFFTTRGEGTGLGLSMVYGSVQRAGGHIKVYSEPGEGTTFRFYLPRARGDLSDASEGMAVQDLPRGEETVLIVDDEEDLLDAAHTHIESLGYKVYTATNAEQAMNILNDDSSVDLLFSDVVMPGGKDGYQLALAAHKMRPHLKILITSGFTQKREEFVNGNHAFVTKLAANLLSKPYTISELAVVIRRTLDSSE